jgi:hypothetical protein
MDLPEPLRSVEDELATSIGGQPGSHRYEVVTAIFGWSAAAALLAYFAALFVGLEKTASWANWSFGFVLGYALKRDYGPIIKRGRAGAMEWLCRLPMKGRREPPKG